MPFPENDDRKAILEVHVKHKKMSPSVDLALVARGTPGMSGADLANLVNEAALTAVRRGSKVVEMHDFEEARDRVLMGQQRDSMVLSDREKEITAYHEAGHALCAALLPNADPVHKVTILPRGMALGVTQQLPEEEKHSYSQEYLEESIVVAMGGRVAEELVFNHRSTGASNDLQVSTERARRMVTEFGMSDVVGPRAWGGSARCSWARTSASRRSSPRRPSRLIDDEVDKMLRAGEDRCRELLTLHRRALDLIARGLLEHETISGHEVNRLIGVAAGSVAETPALPRSLLCPPCPPPQRRPRPHDQHRPRRRSRHTCDPRTPATRHRRSDPIPPEPAPRAEPCCGTVGFDVSQHGLDSAAAVRSIATAGQSWSWRWSGRPRNRGHAPRLPGSASPPTDAWPTPDPGTTRDHAPIVGDHHDRHRLDLVATVQAGIGDGLDLLDRHLVGLEHPALVHTAAQVVTAGRGEHDHQPWRVGSVEVVAVELGRRLVAGSSARRIGLDVAAGRARNTTTTPASTTASSTRSTGRRPQPPTGLSPSRSSGNGTARPIDRSSWRRNVTVRSTTTGAVASTSTVTSVPPRSGPGWPPPGCRPGDARPRRPAVSRHPPRR